MAYNNKKGSATATLNVLPNPQDGHQDQGLTSRRQMTSQLPPFNMPTRTFSPVSQQGRPPQQQQHAGGNNSLKYDSHAGMLQNEPASHEYGHQQQHSQQTNAAYLNYWPQAEGGPHAHAQHPSVQSAHGPYNPGGQPSQLSSAPPGYGAPQQPAYAHYPPARQHNPNGSISRMSPGGPAGSNGANEVVQNTNGQASQQEAYGAPNTNAHGYPMYMGNYGTASSAGSQGIPPQYNGPPAGYAPYPGYPGAPYGGMYAGAPPIQHSQHHHQQPSPAPSGHARDASHDASLFVTPYAAGPYGQMGGGAYGNPNFAPMQPQHPGMAGHPGSHAPMQQHMVGQPGHPLHFPSQQLHPSLQQHQSLPGPYGRGGPGMPGLGASVHPAGNRSVSQHGTGHAATPSQANAAISQNGPQAKTESGTIASTTGNAVTIGERPFKCDQCPQSFQRSHDLKRHKRIHLAIKPFPCPSCDKSFSRKDALKRHILVKQCGQSDVGQDHKVDPS